MLIFVVLALILGGCTPPGITPSETEIKTPLASPSIESFEPGQVNGTVEAAELPAAVEYNLGETTITQTMFSEDSRFRNMPVRMNGIIAVPSGEDSPYPVVVILHGNHPGCPIPEGDMVDRWPCDPELERRNYRGFDFLVRRLAAQGYVALSININAEYTFGFGEPVPVERLEQLVDLHLKSLAAATRGELNNFGVELEGRADLSRLAFIGHSQGGEYAYRLTQNAGMDTPDVSAKLGYGPVHGLLMVAPSANWGGASGARLPLALILPACDSDVINQDGQLFYEITRLDPEQSAWASSVWLERANHNYFNASLSDEAVARPGRPDCEPLLQPEMQRDFLSELSIDFLKKIFSQESGATIRLGMDFQAQAVDQLYGLPARVAALAPGTDRLPLLIPATAAELETNLAGGDVISENLAITYCKEGYYTPSMNPGSEPCKRVNLVVPGNPAMIVASWSRKEGALRFSLPEERDLSQFSAISLRAAVDPLSTLNKVDTYQAFTIQLVDRQGNTASVRTRMDEPALRFTPGYEEKNESFDGGLFTGRVPLTSIRMLLRDFTGVNFAEIRAIMLLFDQTTSGTLFISDLEFVR
jgi:dienelactone hydrolase